MKYVYFIILEYYTLSGVVGLSGLTEEKSNFHPIRMCTCNYDDYRLPLITYNLTTLEISDATECIVKVS